MEYQEVIETQKRIIDTISHGVKDAIIVTDPNRFITHFNKAAEETTRTNVVDTVGKKIDEVLNMYTENGKISADEYCPTGNLDIQGVVYEKKEVKLQTPDDQENIVNIRSHKVKGGSEINLGCIIFIEDTFEQSDLERMKLDFVSMSEHVLRTPITIIRGYISRLLEQKTTNKLDDNEINYLNNAFTGTTDLLTLVEDLLNITEIRKEEGLKLNTTGLNIETLVSKVVSEFKIVAAEKGLQVVFIPPLYSLPMVNAEISKLKIVLQNIIENSIKYTKEGKIDVILSKKDDFVQVAIKDTGRGIPEENINQLFTKFYRVKKALEMEYGMGLGLYIAKK
ncbi:ATP-binding protein, partial [Patescibacteria group bacterium]